MAPKPRNITVDGRTQSILEWATETGIPRRTIFMRLTRGWDAARAVTEKPTAHASTRGRKAVKTRKRGVSLPDLDALAPHLDIKRTLNPVAFAAVQQLAQSEGFFDCYQLLYHHGPMTGQELNEKHRLFGGRQSHKMHSHLSVLTQLGLVKVIGRRRCLVAKSRCATLDVTDLVPQREINWTAARKEETLLPARISRDRQVPDPAQLRAGIGEFRRMMGLMQRLGRPFLEPFCDSLLNFVEREAKRYESLSATPGPVLQLVADGDK